MFAPFPGISPNAIEWGRVDNVSRSPGSPLTGSQQLVRRTGGVWTCTMTWANLRDEYRHELMAWQSRLEGGANYTYLSPADRSQSGAPVNSPIRDYMAGVNYSVNSIATSPSVFTSGSALHQARRGRGFESLAETMPAGVALVNLAQYESEAGESFTNAVIETYGSAYAANAPSSLIQRTNAEINTAFVLSLDKTVADGPQRRIMQIPMSGSTQARIRNFVFHSFLESRHLVSTFYRVSAHAGLRLSVAATSGERSARVTGFPTSTRNQLNLLEGDYLEIGGQLLRLTRPSYVGADGQTLIEFDAPLRADLPVNEPVIAVRPAAKMRLATSDTGHSSRPYGMGNALSTFSMQFIEAID